MSYFFLLDSRKGKSSEKRIAQYRGWFIDFAMPIKLGRDDVKECMALTIKQRKLNYFFSGSKYLMFIRK